MPLPPGPRFGDAFTSSTLDSDLSAALDDVYFQAENGKYTIVPLLWQEVEHIAVEGGSKAESALLFCASPTGLIKLDAVSTDGSSTVELARTAYDLLEPIPSAMALDIVELMQGAIQAGYRALGGVLIHSRTDIEATFPLLIVPMFYRFRGYDLLDTELPDNAKYRGMSREDVSRAIATAVMEFAIENSIQLNG